MAAHLEANPGRARGRQFHTGAHRAARGDRARASREHLRSGAPLPDPVLALLGPDPVPAEPADAARAAARLPARAAQADDRALRPVPRARDDRRDARDAGAHRLRLRSAHPRSRRLVSPRVARRDGAPLRSAGQRSSPSAGGTSPRRSGASCSTLIGDLVGAVIPRYRALAERGQMRAVGHAVRASDRSAAARFQVRARRGSQHAAARSTPAIRAARSGPRGTSRKASASSRAPSARARRAAGRPKARSAARRSSCSIATDSAGPRRAPMCCGAASR